MRIPIVLCGLAVILLLGGLPKGDSCNAQAPAATDTEQLFTKKLEGGSELIFSRTLVPQPSAAAVAGLLKVPAETNLHRIKVELKPADAPSVVLLDTMCFQKPRLAESSMSMWMGATLSWPLAMACGWDCGESGQDTT
jgi:hypothetical protein